MAEERISFKSEGPNLAGAIREPKGFERVGG
jgi:hypothetical protein